ncbi:MAG: hypothetical protein ACLQIB_17155 [Isosphaeraceae bacterium]
MIVPHEPIETGPASERKRAGRFRLSLRALMVFVLVIGGWLGWVVCRAKVQREAVGAITRAGGAVGYSGDDAPRWRQWLVDLFGRDYFETVISAEVDLKDAPGADALMAHVGRLGGLRELSFDAENLTNEGVSHVRHLRELQDLQLFGTFTGAALAHLESLSSLQMLNIVSNCPFRDGLAHLRHLTGLKILLLWDDDRLTDSDLAHVEGMTNLQELNLGPTRVTDAGLVHLRGLKNLRALQFSSDEISIEALAKLKQEWPKLQVVSPTNTPTPTPPTPVNASAPAAQPGDDLVPSAKDCP